MYSRGHALAFSTTGFRRKPNLHSFHPEEPCCTLAPRWHGWLPHLGVFSVFEGVEKYRVAPPVVLLFVRLGFFPGEEWEDLGNSGLGNIYPKCFGLVLGDRCAVLDSTIHRSKATLVSVARVSSPFMSRTSAWCSWRKVSTPCTFLYSALPQGSPARIRPDVQWVFHEDVRNCRCYLVCRSILFFAVACSVALVSTPRGTLSISG